jgi:hypothetical protein
MSLSAQQVKLLKDPLWRLTHLYSVKSAADGRVVPFRPKPEQMKVFHLLLTQRCKRLIVLKARRLGMSTAIDILLADQMLFNAGVQCSIVDQSAADAERKLSVIVKTAIEHLPDWLKSEVSIAKDSGSVLELAAKAGDSPSCIFAGLRARGGTNNWLHLSEWGPIQADDPRRSEEILTGALPSAEHGTIICETTWKGNLGAGHLSQLVRKALETPDEEKTERDWRIVFFPWWLDSTYMLEGNPSTISNENTKYLNEVEQAIGKTFSNGQRLWYDRQQKQLGLFMFREFPSTIEECWKSPVDGAIYADAIGKLRAQGAIGPFPVDQTSLVHTAWDLGNPANTVVWYFQMVAGEIRLVDCDSDFFGTLTERVARMLAKGYPLGWAYLPHDAAATNTSGRTFQQELAALGLQNTRIVPRTADIWIGINRVLSLFPRLTFRTPQCDTGLQELQNYHTVRTADGSVVKEYPHHGRPSHFADALRIVADAVCSGMVEQGVLDTHTGRVTAKRRNRPVVVLTGPRGPSPTTRGASSGYWDNLM